MLLETTPPPPPPPAAVVVDDDDEILLICWMLGFVFSKAGAVSHSFSLALTGGSSELDDGGLVLSLLIVLWYVEEAMLWVPLAKNRSIISEPKAEPPYAESPIK